MAWRRCVTIGDGSIGTLTELPFPPLALDAVAASVTLPEAFALKVTDDDVADVVMVPPASPMNT